MSDHLLRDILPGFLARDDEVSYGRLAGSRSVLTAPI
jgi:hypothetical protein